MKKRMWRTLITMTVSLAMIMVMSQGALAAGVSSEDAALSKALKNAGLKKSQVKHIDTEYDSEDGEYEVEFTKKKNGCEYEYSINAASGKIVKKSLDFKYKKNSSHKKIGKKAARKKAAKMSGVSYNTVKKGTCKYEYDDGKGVYEVKFKKGSRKYECDVLAPTGKVIDYEWKLVS